MSFMNLAQQIVLTLGIGLIPSQAESGPKRPAEGQTVPPSGAASEAPAKEAAKPGTDAAKSPKLETAVLGGGCFWCLDAVYRRVVGVKDVISGYAGGKTPRPTYPMVQTGLTGHAEVVQIVYDPEVVSYENLLKIFWHCHDPTTLNRQGPDVGTEYRSTIMVKDEAQALAARTSMYEAQKEFPVPIVTEIVPLTQFWKAESYHQNYYQRNKRMPYCQKYIAPKLQKLGVRP